MLVNDWSDKFPDFSYFLWNDRDMEDLVANYYPNLLEHYLKLL